MRRNNYVDALIAQCEASCPHLRNSSASCLAPNMPDRYTGIPTKAPTIFPIKSLPTKAPILSPSARPTSSSLHDITLDLEIILTGVSSESWKANEYLYNLVVAKTFVKVVDNPSISIHTVTITGTKSTSKRRLDSSSESTLIVSGRIVAHNVRGLDDASIMQLLDDYVTDGTFTSILQGQARLSGAPGLLDAEVLSLSNNDGSHASSDESTSLRAGEIAALALGIITALILAVAIYVYFKREGETISASVKVEVDTTVTTANPIHKESTIRDSDIIPPTMNHVVEEQGHHVSQPLRLPYSTSAIQSRSEATGGTLEHYATL